MKIENRSTGKIPARTVPDIEKVLATLPKDHLRGITRVCLVDRISDPRLPANSKVPGLYHPRQGTSQAWIEIAVEELLPTSEPWHRRLSRRLTFKNNLAAVLVSLVAQHYYLNFKHSVKKSQLEHSVRTYTEDHFRKMHENDRSLRVRLFKPLQPVLQRWMRGLQKQAGKSQRSVSR